MTNKEYTIFITCNGGKTYNITTYDSFLNAQHDLLNMVELEEKRHRPYYVYNDFFDNKYPASLNCKIFCLKERRVSNWEIYSNTKNSYDNVNKFPKVFSYYFI